MNDSELFYIYLAEDDLDDQQIFEEAVTEIDSNIIIIPFTDGQALVDALSKKNHEPDVVFLDLYMPKMNGEEVLNEIRKNSYLDYLPVVIFSNEYNLDRIANLFELGANRYLHKPESYRILILALERTINSIKNNDLGGTSIINYVE
ncbi:response regulator [uncultured Maribacter sp.]|uniref:response regulator n=1 Tax=uncultured Maribacter sp. TaxID=431308 RepID=UPI0030EBBF42|tara:strand:- start:34876 stop:35316 length:441 start_codon:yes stop_codon:yes gene_type:complete